MIDYHKVLNVLDDMNEYIRELEVRVEILEQECIEQAFQIRELRRDYEVGGDVPL